jgi:hypothetical protein
MRKVFTSALIALSCVSAALAAEVDAEYYKFTHYEHPAVLICRDEIDGYFVYSGKGKPAIREYRASLSWDEVKEKEGLTGWRMDFDRAAADCD